MGAGLDGAVFLGEPAWELRAQTPVQLQEQGCLHSQSADFCSATKRRCCVTARVVRIAGWALQQYVNLENL